MTFMYVLAIPEVIPRFRSVEGPQKDTVRPGVAKQQESLVLRLKLVTKKKEGMWGCRIV